ncbi:PTS sugar transporter subunit IIA [Olsenella sp. Marseille-P4559]|jgi:PTS system N-acetylgalactosamine-specific IIA component|uniref:PTS sugar transporter subunit IIA n=1 Tax=Olsenella sp. Marseille-P4559 TaxID=2364795 RepID=UPI0010325BDD|nr:PTS fructose transporter subunit IIA [Olsenella sp. Marseille-P4559]
MVGFVLTGHGDFAVGLESSVRMIAGSQEEFDIVPFHEDEAGEFPQKLTGTIAASAERNGGVIVFCDLMGGTPFNQAMMNTQAVPGVEVVAGTNLPMLLEVLTTRVPDSTTQELVDCAVEAGKEGVAHMVLSVDADEDDFEGEGL